SLPKFRVNRRARNSRPIVTSASIIRQVSSGDPSSTRRSSYGRLHCCTALRTAERKPASCAPSRKSGITIERSGDFGSVLISRDSSINGNGSSRHPYLKARKRRRYIQTKLGRYQTQWKGMRVRQPTNITQSSLFH